MKEFIKVKTTKQFKNKISNGYLWIFSNEIDKKMLPKQVCCVEVYDSKDNFLCRGVYNPHSLIAVRVITKEKTEKISKDFFIRLIKSAVNHRNSWGIDTRYCRVVYGESDLLPGVVIDRYGDVFVIQFFSYAMELFYDVILESILEIFSPTTIVVRNDMYQRNLEKAPVEKKVVFSKSSKQDTVVTIEHLGAKFLVDVYNGQKTGFYYDQLDNRKYIRSIVNGKKVLDLCCYTGAFSILSALSEAKLVVGVDSSSYAIELARENAKINNVEVNFIEADIEDFLSNNDTKFDVIIFDPPSYAKSNKDVKNALKQYKFICDKTIKFLNDDGIFAFSVCSRFVQGTTVEEIVQMSMLKNKQKGVILYRGTQSLDHPIYLPMKKETEYLKFIAVQLCNN